MARDLNSDDFSCWRLRFVNTYGLYFTFFNSFHFEMLQLLTSEAIFCRTEAVNIKTALAESVPLFFIESAILISPWLRNWGAEFMPFYSAPSCLSGYFSVYRKYLTCGKMVQFSLIIVLTLARSFFPNLAFMLKSLTVMKIFIKITSGCFHGNQLFVPPIPKSVVEWLL